ncbi:MAG TPA: MEDS domain-containing protein, partial [Polyangia bacterium]|nr:MEDS domain-containing protein [Polyangia bacterium]
MTPETSPSGLPTIGQLPWGSHFCQFYSSPQDLIESLVLYFQAGLHQGERCLWITSTPFGTEDARAALRSAVPEVDTHIRRGQLEIIDHDEWYLRAGQVDADTVLAQCVQAAQQALAEGYPGLRVTGNTYWLEREDWTSFMEYEQKVNQTFRHHRVLAMCSYCLDRCHSEGILDVVQHHEFALVRRHGSWELIESASLKLAKEELRCLNEELAGRIAERTTELEQAVRVRDDFLSIASHELRTPLTTLSLKTDNLLRALDRGDELPRDQVVQRMHRVRQQIRRLDHLVQGLLDVSRISAGRFELQYEVFDLGELVREVVARMREELDRTGVPVHLATEPGVCGSWDRFRLDQVITNLLSNAMKYGLRQPIDVTVTPAAGRAQVSVRDRGIGIPPEHHARIFERFERAVSERNYGGLGLGLWISRQIV